MMDAEQKKKIKSEATKVFAYLDNLRDVSHLSSSTMGLLLEEQQITDLGILSASENHVEFKIPLEGNDTFHSATVKRDHLHRFHITEYNW